MKPGDKLWIVDRHGNGREMAVESVGRRWVELLNTRLRVDRYNMQVLNEDRRFGMAYPSEAAYREQRTVEDAWREFQLGVQRRTADGLTVKQIAEATAWLGVEA